MNKGLLLKKEIEIPLEKATLLQKAKALHRTHKNEKIIIKNGSYLVDIYNDNSHEINIKKSVQCGISEWALIRSFDAAIKGLNCLYVLPTFSLKNQYVSERTNKSILFTKYYNAILQSNDAKLAESASIKQFGSGTIVYTGSNTPTAFVSYPADLLIIDELDECSIDYLPMAEERLANSKHKYIIKVGNPTVLGRGIDELYNQTDKKQWFIRHDCGQWNRLDFFKNVVRKIEKNDETIYVLRDKDYLPGCGRDINCICEKCEHPFNRHSAGEWVKENDNIKSGYHINSLFSANLTIAELVNKFNEGLENDTYMQRFYNAYLGLGYIAEGAKITVDMLDKCICDGYVMPEMSHDACIAGIDVNKDCNIIIGRPIDDKIKIIYIGELRANEDVDIIDLLIKYNVKLYVIDALPEPRFSRKIVAKWKTGFMSYFTNQKKELTIDLNNNIVNTSRTFTLDAVKEAIITQNVILPMNVKSISGFYDHMTASTRIFNEKNDCYDWVESGPDHYFLAMSYMLLAKKLLIMAK